MPVVHYPGSIFPPKSAYRNLLRLRLDLLQVLVQLRVGADDALDNLLDYALLVCLNGLLDGRELFFGGGIDGRLRRILVGRVLRSTGAREEELDQGQGGDEYWDRRDWVTRRSGLSRWMNVAVKRNDG